MTYIERKKALAEAIGVDQEDCRAHDKTNLWAVKIGGQREICVIADNVDEAAIALRAKMEEIA